MDEDRRWRVKELADETAICGCRVLRKFNTGIYNCTELLPRGAASFDL
jgi:hypothetical protein